jgi:hypothetical protein
MLFAIIIMISDSSITTTTTTNVMMLQHAVQRTEHAVDSGSGHQKLFRSNFPRLASGARPDGPSHSPKVVGIWVHG